MPADPADRSPEERDDKALMAAHVDGDPDAFGEIVRRHRDRMWAVALRTLGDSEEAADAVQDALISAFRRADSYRGDAAVTTWLHRIVVNACLDRVRRRQARPAVALPDDIDAMPEVPSPRDPQDEALIALDVQQALDTLPVDQRAAIVLVDVLGHSVDDAARVLGCPTGTVKSRCSRGRARLLPLLEHLRNPDAPSGVVAGVGEPAPPDPPTIVDPSSGGDPSREHR
jgi:RNA polymerase sigma-70 factor (ECF subfamily)